MSQVSKARADIYHCNRPESRDAITRCANQVGTYTQPR